ncbi:MAG: hypothetical protein ABIP75_07040 [Pyrinomonadaceae bacterium]
MSPTAPRLLAAAGTLLLFGLLICLLEKTDYRLVYVVLAGVLLVVGSNLIQGWQIGLYAPVSGSAYTGELVPIATEGQEYYHDVLRIQDPKQLLFHYNEENVKLNQHSHTHPPGAIFLFYGLLKLLRHPGLVSLFIAIVSVSFSAFLLHRLLLTEVNPRTARFATFLFLLLPAVQIYYLATLDALIATVLLGVLYCLRRSDQRKYLWLAALLLIISFTLTFVSLFILPVLVLFELVDRRSLRRSSFLLVGLVGFHLAACLLLGYNAWLSFRAASHFENPHGFMLLVDPVNYLFTRLEDVFELAVFLGPWLLLLIVREIRSQWRSRSPLLTRSLLGIATLLGMFLTGAFRTGETARAAIFIFPYFLIPIALLLHRLKPTRSERWQLASLVFAHTVLMQLIGNYFY